MLGVTTLRKTLPREVYTVKCRFRKDLAEKVVVFQGGLVVEEGQGCSGGTAVT